MTGIDAWRRQLLDLPESERLRFLDQHSGLPGPRGNIELALAFADLADAAVIDDLARSDDEYRAFCGTVALGSRAEDAEVLLRLHRAASDQRWRVREAVAMALQRRRPRSGGAARAGPGVGGRPRSAGRARGGGRDLRTPAPPRSENGVGSGGGLPPDHRATVAPAFDATARPRGSRAAAGARLLLERRRRRVSAGRR
jgi:hypothetical protein